MGTKQSKGEDLDDEIGDVNPTHLQEINLQFTRDLEKIEADTFWCLSKIIDDIQDNYIPRDDKNFFIGLQLDENDQPIEPTGTHSIRYLNEINL